MRPLAKAVSLIAAPLIAAALPLAAANAALAVGAKAPTFDTKASVAGKDFDFNLQKALKKGPVVLYFFPKVFTQGCTIEANQFSEAADEFNKLGATVVGVSADPIDQVREFSVRECRNKFAVGVATALQQLHDMGVAACHGEHVGGGDTGGLDGHSRQCGTPLCRTWRTSGTPGR